MGCKYGNENCDCGNYIESQAEAVHVKNSASAYSLVQFTGGPLHGQFKRMDVYTAIIPIQSYGWDEHGRPNAYYQNVNGQNVDLNTLTNRAFTHYVFMINGKPHKNVTANGEYYIE